MRPTLALIPPQSLRLRRTFAPGAAVADSTEEATPDLATLVMNGDQTAEQRLVAKLVRPLQLMLRARRVSAPDRDDLIQETILIVLTRLRKRAIEKAEDVEAFACATCRNLLIGNWRKSSRRDALLAEREAFGMAPLAPPETSLSQHQEADLVRRCMNDMNQSRDRELLQAHYFHNIDKSELCERFGLSGSHFDRVLYNARQRLRKLLEQAGWGMST
jgi:RNA polymerase sigma factor (sigma-70 family)